MKLLQIQKSSSKHSQSGFTIIESLVALVVVAVLLAAVSPVIVLATATRLQSRRVELATQATRAYIDGLRAKTIPDPSQTFAVTTGNKAVSTSPGQYLLSTIGAPTSQNGLYCVNKDGNISTTSCSIPVFFIQGVRSAITPDNPDQGYHLAVRVYRTDAFNGPGSPTTATQGRKQATFTGGLGDRYAPLIETTTDIIRGQASYSTLCQRLGGCQ